MTSAPAMGSPASERARAQRERILRAAKSCFIRHGFHAASMTDIAHAAEMSPGLIYRYFPSKGAIVRAIIEAQLEEGRQRLDQLDTLDDLVQAVVGKVACWRGSDQRERDAALFLDMTAEATRDSEVEAAARRADEVIGERLRDALRRAASGAGEPAPSEERLALQLLALRCLLDGLAVRAIRDPALDPAAVEAMLRAVLAVMFGPASAAAVPG